MLEILAIIWLCNKNKARALARGRKPGGFVGATVALWFGLEFIGAFIGGMAGFETLGIYLLAFAFAVIGAIISVLIAKNCKPGDYVAPDKAMVQSAAYSAPLAAPSRVDIVRESSMVGAIVSWSFTLNGQPIGSLGNGKTMTVYTNQSQNVLVATDAYGTSIAPFVFGALSGGYTELHFKINRFVPEKSRGLLAAGTPQPAPATPQPQGAPQPVKPVFCSACGTKLTEGMQFCLQCGARCDVALQNAVQDAENVPNGGEPAAMVQPIAGVSPPVAVRAQEPPVHQPVRALWAAVIAFGVWLLMLLLQCAMGKGTLINTFALYMMTNIMLGAGAYLMIQRGVKLKLIAAGILLAEALMITFNQTVIILANKTMGSMSGFFRFYEIWPGLGFALIFSAIVAGVTLLFSNIWRNTLNTKRVSIAGWIAAGATCLYGIIRMTILYLPAVSSGLYPAASFAITIIGYILDAAATGLTVMVLTRISRQRKERLRLSVWAIIWCTLCSLAMLASLIFGFADKYPTPVLLILQLAALAGFILLLCGKREGFFISLIAVSVYLLSTFETSLRGVLYGSPEYIAAMLGAVAGAANPVITWFSIRGAWLQQNVQMPVIEPIQQKQVKKFPKAAAIVMLAIGAGLLTLPLPFIIESGYAEGMGVCLLIGAAVTALSVWAVVSLFGKRSRYYKWLEILMQVLFWMLCALVAGTVIVSLLN